MVPPRLHFDRQTILATSILTTVIELLCVVCRFGFGLKSTVATASTIGKWTFGYRIHHGYIGLFLLPVGLILYYRYPTFGKWLVIFGAALLVSDLIHHFLVLWPITGSPQFDIVYPQ